jgi:DNA-binding NarL/FixJ family response regulator
MANNATALSAREISVLALLAQGWADQEIAENFGLVRTTVYCYVQAIKRKTGISSRVLLAFYAYSKGYVGNGDIKEAIQLERQKKQ